MHTLHSAYRERGDVLAFVMTGDLAASATLLLAGSSYDDSTIDRRGRTKRYWAAVGS